MNSTRYICTILITLTSLFFDNQAYPWDNIITHKDLSKIAAQQSVLSKVKGDYLKTFGFNNELLQRLTWNGRQQYVIDWISEGAELEDEGSNLQGFSGAARYTNHFHNPLKPWDAAGLTDLQSGESALKWAQDSSRQPASVGGDWSWKKIRDCFYSALTSKKDADRQANFAQTFRGLGHQMHLIQDMSVPAHVRNDAHPEDSLLEFNRLTGDYYFESWAKNYYWRINPYASTPAFPSVDLNIVRNGLSPISQFIDSDQYNGFVPLTNNLTWGLSEYTNFNFFSDDTIFTETFSNSDNHYFPYPGYINQSQCYEQFDQIYSGTNKKRTYWRKKCPGELVDHFVTPGPFFNSLLTFTWDLQRHDLWTDEATHNDYASKLVPRAVGYSAGLLNYFFRGKIDAINAASLNDASSDSSGVKLKVKNSTPGEAMGPGKFVLSYQYKEAGSDNLIFGISDEVKLDENITSGNVTTSDLTFTYADPIPSFAQEIQYFLIYRGKLGSEEDAVAVGKVDPSGEYIFLVSASSLQAQLFKIGISNGLYQLTPAEGELNLQVSNFDGRNLTVQSNPEKTEHYAVLSIGYYGYITSYGINLGGGYFGSPYYYRPGDFIKGSPYVLSNLGLSSYNNPIPLASGRRPFLVSDDELVGKDITVLRENSVPDNPCENNHYIAYKDWSDQWVKAVDLPKTAGEEKITRHPVEIEPILQTNGMLTGYKIVDYGISTSSKSTCPYYFAVLGPSTVVYDTYESEETYEDSIDPAAGMVTNNKRLNSYPGVVEETTTDATYAEKKSTDNKLTTYKLYFGQDLIDEFNYNESSISTSMEKIDFGTTSNTTGVWNPWNGIGTTAPYARTDTYDGNMSGNTKTIPLNGSTYTGFNITSLITGNGKKFIKIWDYDNYESEEYYIGIIEYNETDNSFFSEYVTRDVGIKGGGTSYTFSKSGTATWNWWGGNGNWSVLSWNPSPFVITYNWYSDPDWKYVNDGEGGGTAKGIEYAYSKKEKNTTKYKLIYKIAGNLQIIDLPVSVITRNYQVTGALIDTDKWQVQEVNPPPSGQRINGVSCQINKTNMVYTYIAEQYNSTTKKWDFTKRIIGIINIADEALPPGSSQEIAIDDSNAAQLILNNYDYKNLAGIGVHKSK